MSEVSAPSMLSPKVLIPFMLTGTIWGSTWFVITGQISDVPAAWGVFYRFMLATPALFVLAVVMGNRLKLNRPEHMLALGVGIAQFSGNFLLVYHAESHITSGIVAVMFALLMVPNAIFAKVFIGEKVQGGFIGGSLVAIAGVGMLLVHEWNAAPLGGNVGLGIVLAIGGMLAASIANVVQANPTGRGVPMVSFLAWAMVYGTAFDLVYALVTVGPPQVPSAWQFWAGTAYLAIIGSVVTFPLHYNLVREIGAGRTAYNGIVTVCVAMGLSTLFEGFEWDALSAGGMGLALLGMGLALRSKQKKK
ncbi:drug/metabolite transporter (DMT)-like permease [Erythromicrobium ramosum]|uniref:Drug/metabolite transporter (DMT)-like permease n=2 Tax=Erythrobacter ramosus TaxID=35811 RepID=A0ABR6HW84_9SPHN|nr:DMT family transporter [Erythrobacter ramosus]MBB3774918.1 drug/metabolite transporter (DMT)-like permease [Erythrobacter ramosus]